MKIHRFIVALLFGGALKLIAAVVALPDDRTTDSNWRTAVPATADDDRKYGTDGFVLYGWGLGSDTYLVDLDSNNLARKSLRQLPSYIAEVSTDGNTRLYGGGTKGDYGRLQYPSSPDVTAPAPVLLGAKATNDDTIRLTIARATSQAFRLTLIIGGFIGCASDPASRQSPR